MENTPWNDRANKCTMFHIIDFSDSGEIRVFRETVPGVMDKKQVTNHLKNIQPVYGPTNPKDDPLFIDANGYCRLVFAFDKLKPNCLFHKTWPFSLKHRGEGGDASPEFDCLETISRGDMGYSGNEAAISAFFIDDKNSKVDPYLIPYNLFAHFSQDASDENAYVTSVTIDPSIKNNNG